MNGDFGTLALENISSLNNKDVGYLWLYGCNAGHYDYKDNNVASNFAKKVNGAPVIARDGTVYTKGQEYLPIIDLN